MTYDDCMKQIMKFSAIIALLISTPVVASSAAIWDCGKGITVTSGKGELGFYFKIGPRPSDPDIDNLRRTYRTQFRGTRHFDLKWDFRPERGSEKPEVWLNGKVCKRTN